MARRRLTYVMFVAVSVMGALSVHDAASAQRLPFDLPPLIPSEPVTIYDVPNVPDARGCVKMCFRDDSPCDPPGYKRADNRCRSVD